MRKLIIGVDLHQRRSMYVVGDASGTIYAEQEIPNADREAIRDFVGRWDLPETQTTLVVEATGGWYWFVDFVQPLVDRVKLADPFWAAQCLKGRAAKNDRLDARALVALEIRGQIQEGYIMPRELRELRDVLRTRLRLVQERTALKNRIHAVLLKNGIPYEGSLYGPGGRAWLARQEVAEAWRLQIEEQLALIQAYGSSIRRLERWIAQNGAAKGVPYAGWLQTIPGVGPIWGMMIALEIGDIERFRSPDELVCYAGLAPFVHESSDHRRYYGLHLHRNTWLKGALGMVALHAKKSPKLKQEYERARRRHKAIVANLVVARKLARIIFWMLKRKENFRESDPKAVRSA